MQPISSRDIPPSRLQFLIAPIDNHGKGESFSPAALLATSLVTGMMTVMGIGTETHNIFMKK